MKFYLVAVNAKYIHTNPAVYSLAAYAKAHAALRMTERTLPGGSGDSRRQEDHLPAWDLSVREYTINQQPGDILSSIYAEHPDAVGFSCYIWNWNMVRFFLRELPKILPGVRIFLGGPEVSYHSEQILAQFPQVEAVMIGEGEETFAELLEALSGDASGRRERSGAAPGSGPGPLSKVKGLMLRSGFTGERPLLPMDSVPFFYGESALFVSSAGKKEATGISVGENEAAEILTTAEAMTEITPAALGHFQNRILYYESSRGCPYRCSYCLSSLDKTLRLRSTDQVKKHLDLFLAAKVPQVKFIDRTFNAKSEHALFIWNYLKEHDNGITNFHFEIAAELLTEEQREVIRSMRPGLIQLEIGVQTANPEALRTIRRPADPGKLRAAVSSLREAGNVHLHLDLIAGLPQEDRASFIRSFNEVFSMRPHELQLGFLKVLKGTAMEEMSGEYGLKYLSEPPYEVLSTKWISYEDVREFHRVEEMLEVYYNSCQFTQTLPLLLERFPSPYDFFLALSGWYADRGYFVQVPSRSRRYEILLEFAASLPSVANDDGNTAVERCEYPGFPEKIREALTLDYYLREKPRRLPSFVTCPPDDARIDYDRRDPVTGNFLFAGSEKGKLS